MGIKSLGLTDNTALVLKKYDNPNVTLINRGGEDIGLTQLDFLFKGDNWTVHFLRVLVDKYRQTYNRRKILSPYIANGCVSVRLFFSRLYEKLKYDVRYQGVFSMREMSIIKREYMQLQVYLDYERVCEYYSTWQWPDNSDLMEIVTVVIGFISLRTCDSDQKL